MLDGKNNPFFIVFRHKNVDWMQMFCNLFFVLFPILYIVYKTLNHTKIQNKTGNKNTQASSSHPSCQHLSLFYLIIPHLLL